METLDKALIVGVGFLAGVSLSAGLDWIRSTESNTAVMFREEGKPLVIRTTEYLERDQIYVENPKKPNEYIPLSQYLKARGLEGDDADIEKVRIKEQVGF